jgi:small subunit ribosomal protein S20
MANHKSAIKAHGQSLRRREHNKQLKSRMRHALTAARSAIDAGDAEKANVVVRTTVSLIDNLAGKGIIHHNAAARHKSRLSRRLRNATASAA